jgi:hypothetical protein
MHRRLTLTAIALVVTTSGVPNAALAPMPAAQRLVYSATWNAIPVAL